MPEPDLVELFARPLHRAGARYLVAGSVGAMLYSEPRLTIDIDPAVALDENDLSALPTIFAEPDFYCPPLAVIQSENRRTCRAHFNVLHIPTGLKADFYPSQHDSFFDWARDHRQTASPGGGDKHVRDLLRMIELSGDQIDREPLIGELQRRNLLEHFRTMVPGFV